MWVQFTCSCELCSQISARSLVILGIWIRRKMVPDGKWDEAVEQMMLNFSETAHPIFLSTSALERGELRSKGGGKKTIHFNGSEENIELILRTVISANQLSVYGAVADLCRELPKHSRASGKLDVEEHLETMEIPTELSNPDHHADEEQQGNLLLEFERKFDQLSKDLKLSKLCLDAGLKSVEIGQFFITRDAEGPDEMKNWCREFSRPRNEKGTVARGWIDGGTKIGPVLDIKICRHQDRYGIEILVESLFQDGTASLVLIVNGVDTYVTETTETITLENTEHRAAGKLIAAVKLSSVSCPLRDRNWIEINPEEYDHDCFLVSKAMIRLLRHSQSVQREDDGAVRFDIILEGDQSVPRGSDGAIHYNDTIEECRKQKFDDASQKSISDWITFFAKRRRTKEKVSKLLEP